MENLNVCKLENQIAKSLKYKSVWMLMKILCIVCCLLIWLKTFEGSILICIFGFLFFFTDKDMNDIDPDDMCDDAMGSDIDGSETDSKMSDSKRNGEGKSGGSSKPRR